MAKRKTMSTETRTNWLIDAALFVGAVLASLSGVYFLFLPSGGSQGGRNALYGVTVLFGRSTWSDLHTWSGLLMIVVALIHLVWHWRWVERMGRRVVNGLLHREFKLGKAARFNLILNVVVAVSFVVTAVSGVYFLFLTSGGYQGGRNPDWDPGFLFSRTTWDLLHTWSGVVMIVAAVLHFAIHWRWVKNVSAKFFQSLGARSERPRPTLVQTKS